jgi:hypothetical protein
MNAEAGSAKAEDLASLIWGNERGMLEEPKP